MRKSEIIVDYENRLKKLARDEEIILFDVTQPKPDSSTTEKLLTPFTYYPFIPQHWSLVSRGLTGFMLTCCIIFTIGLLMNSRMHHGKSASESDLASKSATVNNHTENENQSESTSNHSQASTRTIPFQEKIINLIRHEIGRKER